MICPHCTVGEISDETGQCVLCGSSPGGSVTVDHPMVDETRETVQRELKARFRIDAVIGRGTKSVVYEAQELDSGRTVALKVIPLQRGLHPDLARFDREAGIAASLSHSHIVPVFDFGRSRALLWYSMEYVKAQSLAALLRDSGPLELETCLSIIEQAASALDYIHRRGLVHGNVKPANILVEPQGWTRLSDAAVMSAFGSRPGSRSGKGPIGTPEYAAPERFRARTGSASIDQYALAVVAYECLSAMLPFVGDSADELERLHRTETPPLLRDVRQDIPANVDEAIQRAMSKAVVERFPNVLDFVSLLRGDWAPASAPLVVPDARAGTPQVVLIDPAHETVDSDDVKVSPARRPFTLTRFFVIVAAVLAAESVMLWLGSRPSPVSNPEAAVMSAPQFAERDPPADFRTSQPPRPDSGVAAATATQGVRGAATGETATPTRPPSERAATPTRRQPVTRTVPRPPPRQVPTPTSRRQPPSVASGLLFVNATPWGQLFVDGESMGNTPKRSLPITAGTHRIRVERPGFEPYEIEIQVAPGQQVRLTNIVLKPLP